MVEELRIDINDNSDSWNEGIEITARDVGEASKSYKLLHIREAQIYMKSYNRLMVAGILTGPLAGVLSGIEAALKPPEDDPIIPVLVILLGFLSGIIVASIKFGKYDEVSNANKSAAASYTSLESNVRRQLGLYRKDRVNANKYMEWLETKYEELFRSAPLLPPGSYKNHSNEDMKIPLKYGSKITIDSNYRRSKAYEIANITEIKINSDLNENENKEKPKVLSLGGNKTIKRTQTMSKIPQLNQYSDKMLQYEMKRMMGV